MKPNKFSVEERAKILDRLSKDYFDILVIGGGITGAGIALDASARGLKVALVEKGDFASGTSSKSTKLIHGGLRYLKNWEFSLVRKIGKERAVLHKLAPHLVLPEKVLLPILKNAALGPKTYALGLWIYDFLANVKGNDQRKMLSKKEALAIEPLLPKNKTLAAVHYAEYRTDDARLTLEVIKTALLYDAAIINYNEVSGLDATNHRIQGAQVRDLISDKSYNIKARYVVNATGPWVDHLRVLDAPIKGKKIKLSKGVHIVFDKKKLPIRQSIYFEGEDGRMIFVVPRAKVCYLGTTDTPFDALPDQVDISTRDIQYLLSQMNDMFPDIHLKPSDIISAWAGLRPLIHEEGKSLAEISRKDEIFISDKGLISIAGGKLTGYRLMAKRVVDLIRSLYYKEYNSTFGQSTTQNIVILGGIFENFEAVRAYIETLTKQFKSYNLESDIAEYLVHNYGKQSEHILAQLDKLAGTTAEEKLIRSELLFCMDHEMVVKPLDFFVRRTGKMYFDVRSVIQWKDIILSDMQKRFNWTQEKNMYFENQLNILVKGFNYN